MNWPVVLSGLAGLALLVLAAWRIGRAFRPMTRDDFVELWRDWGEG